MENGRIVADAMIAVFFLRREQRDDGGGAEPISEDIGWSQSVTAAAITAMGTPCTMTTKIVSPRRLC